MAIWYDRKEPIRRIPPDLRGHVNYRKRTRRYLMRDGRTKPASVSVHPDLRVHAVVEQGREAEMMQAIDRLRLIHSAREKTVYILCNIPLNIPVDELVTWRELVGDSRGRIGGVRGERLGCAPLGPHGTDPPLPGVVGYREGGREVAQ
jgi:hypothetical protein